MSAPEWTPLSLKRYGMTRLAPKKYPAPWVMVVELRTDCAELFCHMPGEPDPGASDPSDPGGRFFPTVAEAKAAGEAWLRDVGVLS